MKALIERIEIAGMVGEIDPVRQNHICRGSRTYVRVGSLQTRVCILVVDLVGFRV